MNAEIKAQWLAALRSGEYQQGKRSLNCNGQFCCLGVLCDLAVKAGVEKWIELGTEWGFRLPTNVAKKDGYSYESEFLPPQIAEWAGLDDNSPHADGYALVDYNDGNNGLDEHTFTEIADLIERNL